MKFLIAVSLGLVSPTVAARIVLTLDKISGDRCFINVVMAGGVIPWNWRVNAWTSTTMSIT